MQGVISGPIADKYELLDLTLCPKDDNPYHKLDCIYRTCDRCGVHLLDKSVVLESRQVIICSIFFILKLLKSSGVNKMMQKLVAILSYQLLLTDKWSTLVLH